MQPSSRRPRRRIFTALLWTGAVVLVLLVAIVGLASIRDWNFARGRVASIASSLLGEPVSIDGNLSAHLLSAIPSVQVEKIRVANPDWAATDDLTHNFAMIDRLAVALNLGQLFRGHVLLETLEIDNPQIAIVGNEEGRYNFSRQETRDKKDEERKPPNLPGVRKLSMRGGQVYVSDAVHKLKFKGVVEANEQAARPEDIPFHLRGEGTLNDEPFALIFKGGALANIKMDEPYEFDADVKAGKTHATAKGKFEKPFDVARLAVRLDVQGDNLAHLYYLTNLALPFTPPYRVSGDLATSERMVTVKDLKGTVGKSDIGGDVAVDLKGERPKLTAQLRSHSLNLADLSPAFGKGVAKDTDNRTADSQAPKNLPPTKLLPTYDFEFDRLKVMDAAVTLHADSVQTVEAPFTGVDIKVALNDSVLDLNPLVFTLPQGKIEGAVHIDARKKPAATKADLRLTNVDLNQFKGKNSPSGPLGGELEARAQLAGIGNSVHDFAASSNGKVTAIVPHGEIRRAFAELLGINIAQGLGLLLTKNQQRSTIRCGVATFDVHEGDANVQQLLVDTDVVRIQGDGKVDLDTEALDLNLKGQPKKFRLLRLKTPVTLNGTLRKPSVGVKAGDTAKQVGIAAAVGAVLAPLAAAIAFIDPGLAKDENCSALLAEAEKEKPNTDRIQAQHAAPTKDKS